MVVVGDFEGEMGEDGQRIQSYKMNKFWGTNVQHGDCSWQYCIIHLNVAKTVEFESSHHRYRHR